LKYDASYSFFFSNKYTFKNMRKYFLLIVILISILSVTAQVEVRNEPRHHNVFENEFVRILDVHLGPGDTTLYHLHNTPSVFIVFTNTNVGSQLLGKQTQKGANVTGDVSYDGLNTPRVHRVWNEDTSWFHVMDVELTNTKQKMNVAVLQNPALKLLFNEQQVIGYSINLNTSITVDMPANTNGYLLVSQTESVADLKINGQNQYRILKPGNYTWINAGQNFSLKAKNDKPARFVLLQFK